MSIDKQTRLAERALRLKKAWLLAAAFLGTADQLEQANLEIPDYHNWNNKGLKRHIQDLDVSAGVNGSQFFR